MNTTGPSLTIYQQSPTAKTFTVDGSVVKLGRLPSCHVVLEDPSVARMHAVIEHTGEQLHIIDLGSASGTFLNGERVHKAVLAPGDSIRIGETTISVCLSAVCTNACEADKTTPPPKPAVVPAVLSTPVTMVQPLDARLGLSAVSQDGKAVSVEARIGDATIATRQLIPSEFSGPKTSTKFVGLIGAALLVLGLGLLAHGVSVAANSKAAHAAWMQKDPAAAVQRKAHRFRPAHVESVRPYQASKSTVVDVAAVGGLLGGLVLVGWWLARRRRESISPHYHIGSAAGVDFETADAPEMFTMVESKGDGYVLHTTEYMHGTLSSGDAIDAGASLPIDESTKATLQLGHVTFEVSVISRPVADKAPLFSVDGNFAASLSGVALVVAILFGLKAWAFEDSHALAARDGESFALLDQDDGAEKDDALLDEPEPTDEQTSEDTLAGGGKAAALESGRMGLDGSDGAAAKFKLKNINDNPSLAKRELIAMATQTGAVGAISGQTFTALNSLHNVSSGLDDETLGGDLLGEGEGSARGFGLGFRGFGPGGDGTGWGTVGGGTDGLIGRSSGPGGPGWEVGTCKGKNCEPGKRRNSKVPPPPTIGPANIGGGCDEAIIRRHVRRRIPKIKYCYERELLAKPALSGTVAAKFMINPAGLVIKSSAAGMDSEVSQCVAREIKAIKFPQCGSFTEVRKYPFRFRGPMQ